MLTAFGMPCRGEPSVRPFFVWCRVCPNTFGYPNANGANQRCTHRRDAMTFASKREQSRIYSSYAEREQIVRIKLRLYTMYLA